MTELMFHWKCYHCDAGGKGPVPEMHHESIQHLLETGHSTGGKVKVRWFKNLFKKKPKQWYWRCNDCTTEGVGDESWVRDTSTRHLIETAHTVYGGETD